MLVLAMVKIVQIASQSGNPGQTVVCR